MKGNQRKCLFPIEGPKSVPFPLPFLLFFNSDQDLPKCVERTQGVGIAYLVLQSYKRRAQVRGIFSGACGIDIKWEDRDAGSARMFFNKTRCLKMVCL